MIVARSIQAVRSAVNEAKKRGGRVGLVPTMGFLHAGHLSLVDVARDRGATFTVVSIFVNPTQFGPNEDLASYPRDEVRDEGMLRDRGVDVLFLPPVEVMYPGGTASRIEVGEVGESLEGERRPGHFSGVATVVLKLFNIVMPDLAVFGQKDAQQCAVIRAVVYDLNVPVELHFGPTVRDNDGLAMSSRNSRLSPDERKIAPALHRALQAGRAALLNGARDADDVRSAMTNSLNGHDGVQVDYLELVDPDTFRAPADLTRELLLVGAVRVGRTRLIDNIPVSRMETRR